jgi:hypothetical protein
MTSGLWHSRLVKYQALCYAFSANPHHDERGLFATADGAVATVGSPARKPRPTDIQVASNDAVMSDVGGTNDADTVVLISTEN